jgi:hypothetical protein
MTKTASLLASLVLATACGPHYINGTTIEDTPGNRSVLNVLAAYKQAFERRDVDAVVALCSPKYFEDNGNADPSDDYGFTELKAKVLPDTFKRLSEARMDLEVKEIKVEGDRARADVRFNYRARMALPSGDKWSSDTEVNRLELERENGAWKITSGL